MKKLITLLTCVVCCLGCSSNYSEFTTISISKLDIDVEFEEECVDVKNIKIIPLEYTDQSILGERLIISSSEESLILHDEKSIYFFDSESGKFERVINHQGKANSEYLEVCSVVTDGVSRELYVIDLLGEKINVYNYDGGFVRQHKTDVILTFDRIDDNRFIGYNANVENEELHKYNFCLYDKDFNFIKGLDNRTAADIPISYWSPNYCKKYGKGSYVYIRDTVFSVTLDGLTPLVAVDKGEYKLPADLSARDEASHKYITSDEVKLFGDYLLYLSFRFSGFSNRLEMWDLKNQKLLFRYDPYSGEIERRGFPIKYEGQIIYPRIMYVDENDRIYCILPQNSVENLGIENNDNPVIISFELF